MRAVCSKLVLINKRLWKQRQKLEDLELSDECDEPEREDEKPCVVVLKSGDLTAEEAALEKRLAKGKYKQIPGVWNSYGQEMIVYLFLLPFDLLVDEVYFVVVLSVRACLSMALFCVVILRFVFVARWMCMWVRVFLSVSCHFGFSWVRVERCVCR